jgi:hypothetical protein
MMHRRSILLAAFLVHFVAQISVHAQSQASIAADGFVWVYPLLQNYRVMYDEAINTQGIDYLGPFNTIHHRRLNAEAYQTSAWLDVRQEPVVLVVPPLPTKLYSVIRVTDMQTYVAAEFKLRPGTYVFTGKTRHILPAIRDSVIRCESDFLRITGWTQVREGDTAATLAYLKGMSVAAAHDHYGTPGPTSFVPSIRFPAYSPTVFHSADVLPIIGQLLTFTEIHPDDRIVAMSLMKLQSMPADSVTAGFIGGLARIREAVKGMGRQGNGWTITEGLYGPRSVYQGNALRRAAACMDGMYGPTDHETLVAFTYVKASSATLTFRPSDLPALYGYWSISVDGMPGMVLTSTAMKRTKKGNIEIVIAPTRPKGDAVNWLQAPSNQSIGLTMLMHAPKPELFSARYTPPAVQATAKR